MNKTLPLGLAAVLVAGGLGLTSPAQAAPTRMTTNGLSAAASPLHLCDLLPVLCDSSAPTATLLEAVDSALDSLLGAAPGLPSATSAEALVDAIRLALANPTDPQAVANAIASQLASAGLSPAALTQVLSGLSSGSANLPGTGALTGLVSNLVTTVQDLVTGLLGLGGGTPHPAQVQALVTQILGALASGDTAALQSVLSSLLSSLPGGAGLDPSILTGLINQLLGFLQTAGGPNRPSPTGSINQVNAAINPAPAIRAVKYHTSLRPTIRGTGAAGAVVTVRTTSGTVLGNATVNSAGAFALKSRKLKLRAYSVSATQTPPGRVASVSSAATNFRVVSAKPVIKTSSKKKFKTHRPKIMGVGFPGAKIVLKSSSGKRLGSVKVRSNGTWTVRSKSLKSGTTKVKAIQTGHGKKKTTKTYKVRVR